MSDKDNDTGSNFQAVSKVDSIKIKSMVNRKKLSGKESRKLLEKEHLSKH